MCPTRPRQDTHPSQPAAFTRAHRKNPAPPPAPRSVLPGRPALSRRNGANNRAAPALPPLYGAAKPYTRRAEIAPARDVVPPATAPRPTMCAPRFRPLRPVSRRPAPRLHASRPESRPSRRDESVPPGCPPRRNARCRARVAPSCLAGVLRPPRQARACCCATPLLCHAVAAPAHTAARPALR